MGLIPLKYPQNYVMYQDIFRQAERPRETTACNNTRLSGFALWQMRGKAMRCS